MVDVVVVVSIFSLDDEVIELVVTGFACSVVLESILPWSWLDSSI